MERDNVSLRIENSALRTSGEQQKKKISVLESHICKTESQIDTLLFRLNGANDIIRHMKEELKNKDMQLNQRVIEKMKVKEKYTTKIQMETDKMGKELEAKLRRQREILQSQMKEKDEKLKLMKQILHDDEIGILGRTESKESIPVTTSSDTEIPVTPTTIANPATVSVTAASSDTAIPKDSKTPSTAQNEDQVDTKIGTTERIPVVNLRYRRSQSAERWVDHRPSGLVPVGTILQPHLRQKRNLTQLTDPRDITDGASKYCLVAQEQDDDGQLETKLYKGDILPTSGGGAQVVFNDMEHLKQVSPVPRRKRSSFFSPEKKAQSSPEENNTKKPRV